MADNSIPMFNAPYFNMGQAMSPIAQHYRDYVDMMRAAPEYNMNVMKAAQAGAYTRPGTLQAAGGDYLPQVTGAMGLSQLQNPGQPMVQPNTMNLQSTPAPQGGLMVMPEWYGKPLSSNESQSRDPASYSKVPKTEQEQKVQSTGMDLINAELEKINSELKNPQKPMSLEESLNTQNLSYDALNKMYPGMVDVEGKKLHPWLQTQLSGIQNQAEKRQNALLARKDQLLNMLALSGAKAAVAPAYQRDVQVGRGSQKDPLEAKIKSNDTRMQQILQQSGLGGKLGGPDKIKNPTLKQEYFMLQETNMKLRGLGQNTQAPQAAPQQNAEQKIRSSSLFSKLVDDYRRKHPQASKQQAEQIVINAALGR